MRRPAAPNNRRCRLMVARERATEHQHHRRARARSRTRCPRARTATANPLAPMATPAPAAGDSPARGGARRHHRRTTAPGTRRPGSIPPPPTSPHDQRHTEHQHQPHRRPARARANDAGEPALVGAHDVTASSSSTRRRRTSTAAPSRPLESARAWPPCTVNSTDASSPPGRHSPHATHAPTAPPPSMRLERRPSGPTT
jgi:hypothetical protein